MTTRKVCGKAQNFANAADKSTMGAARARLAVFGFSVAATAAFLMYQTDNIMGAIARLHH